MKLYTNHFPIQFAAPTFTAYRFRNLTEEQLGELRKQMVGRAAIYEFGSQFYVLPLKENVPLVGGTRIEAPIGDFAKLARSGVHGMIKQHFETQDLFLLKDEPLLFTSKKENFDVLKEKVGLRSDKQLALRQGYCLDTHLFQRSDQLSKAVSLVIQPLQKWDIKYSVADLWNKNIPFQNRMVRLPDGKVGVMQKGKGEKVSILTQGEQLKCIPSELIPIPNHENLTSLLTLRCDSVQEARQILEEVYREELHPDQQKLKSRVMDMREYCQKNIGDPGIESDFGWQLGEWTTPKFRMRQISEPQYRYHPTYREVSKRKKTGLIEKGPFSRRTFPDTPMRILAVVTHQSRPEMEQFLTDLEQGEEKGFVKGFPALMHTRSFEIEWVLVDKIDSQAIRNGVEQAIKSTTSDNPFRLAVVETHDQERILKPSEDPYVAIRAYLLKCRIPAQSISLKSLKRKGEERTWLLFNTALAIYAKMGGIPWVLPQKKGQTHELVLGIGQAKVRTDEEKEESFVGITTIFTGEGRFVKAGYSREVPLANFEEQLLDYLANTLAKLKVRFQWDKGKVVRMVFHVFKSLKQVQIDKIKTCIQTALSDYEVEFSFLTVSSKHAYHLWDSNRENRSREPKSALQAPRGSYLKLGESTALLSMHPATESGKYAQPMRIHLHEASNHRNLDDLCEQIFQFASLSYRSFTSASKPITLLYSQLIAQALGEFRQLSDTRISEQQLIDMDDKLWFL